MSDDDYEYDDYDGYVDEEPDDDEIEIQNSFFEAENLVNSNPMESLNIFKKVTQLEQKRGSEREWTFKSLIFVIQLQCKLGLTDDIRSNVKSLIDNLQQASKNEAIDAINKVIHAVSGIHETQQQQINFEILLDLLDQKNQDQLWINGSLRLCHLYLEKSNFEHLSDRIEKIKLKLQSKDDSDLKMNALMEMFSLEIQLCIQNQNQKRLKEIQIQTKTLNFSNFDAKSIAIVKENCGKLLLLEKQYQEATVELLESFRFYQEVGHPQAKIALKYLTLASILSKSEINVFQQNEAKVYINDPEILIMQDLRQAYENNDLKRFNNIINNKQNKILSDEFMKKFVNDLIRIISLEKIVYLTQPYSKISLKYIANELFTNQNTIENYLVELIAEERINGKIDIVNGYYQKNSQSLNDVQLANLKSIQTLIQEIKNF